MLDNYEEEFQPLNLEPQFMDIRWTEKDVSVRNLWKQYLKGELVVSPGFQRNYVWDQIKASRFIESLLLNLPVPPIFVSEEENRKDEVVDGQQRLVSIFKFLQPLARSANGKTPPKTLAPLSLKGLEALSNLNGRDVTSLSILDRGNLWDKELKILQLPVDVHPDMKFELFIRLNLGSLNLNPQELRNCMFRGPYNDLINRLSTDRSFLDLWGRATPDKRMNHSELVLRFFAFLHSRDSYSVPLKSFLNNEMNQKKLQADPRFGEEFKLATTWIKKIFDKEAFKRFKSGNSDNPAGEWSQRKSAQLFELEMVSFGEMGDQLNQIWESYNCRDQQLLRAGIRRQLAGVMSEERFIDSLYQKTTDAGNIRYRFDKWIGALSEFVVDPDQSLDKIRQVHESLRESSVCAICPSKMNIEDATWKLENGSRRLAHRFCAT